MGDYSINKEQLKEVLEVAKANHIDPAYWSFDIVEFAPNVHPLISLTKTIDPFYLTESLELMGLVIYFDSDVPINTLLLEGKNGHDHVEAYRLRRYKWGYRVYIKGKIQSEGLLQEED